MRSVLDDLLATSSSKDEKGFFEALFAPSCHAGAMNPVGKKFVVDVTAELDVLGRQIAFIRCPICAKKQRAFVVGVNPLRTELDSTKACEHFELTANDRPI